MDLPLFYSAKEIRARIVDEKTGEPIEGAVVVAQWVFSPPSGRGPTLHIVEAVTDKQGEFFIAAWGPKPRRPLTQLAHHSPQLLIFKHGYVPLNLHNESIKRVMKAFPNYKTMTTRHLVNAAAWYEGEPNQSVQECMWNGLNIQIERFSGTSDRWLWLINAILTYIARDEDKEVRQLFQVLAAERNYFKTHPVSREQQVVLFDLVRRIERALE